MNNLSTKFDTIIESHISNYDQALLSLQMMKAHRDKAVKFAELAGCGNWLYKVELFNEEKRLKQWVWRSLIDSTRLSSLMDSKTRDEMNNDLDKEPPLVTEENARAILSDLFNRKDQILADSLLNVFYSLVPKYKSNDKFKLTGNRIILWIGHGYSSFRLADKFTDLDRFFHFIDGVKFDNENRTETLGHRVEWSKEEEIETDYFRIKKFKNGNAHLYFKRKDLIDQCNRLIAYHNKNKLGAAA